MDEKKASGHSVALAVVALLAGILIGIVGSGAYEVDDPIDTDGTGEISATAVSLRTALHDQWVELSGLNATMLTNVYTEQADSAAVRDSVSESSAELGGLLATYYGEEVAADFTTAWSEYTDQLQVYAVAAREDEAVNLRSGEVALAEAIAAVAEQLSEVTDIERDVWDKSITEYGDHLVQFLTSFAAANYSEAYMARREAATAAAALADMLSDATLERYPDQF
ncbi:MAG: hypothetical protein WD467_03610 [Candidatus Saccharimonadales bacterium]